MWGRGEDEGLFGEIKDLHISEVGRTLHGRATDILETYREKEGLRTVEEVNRFVKKFTACQAEHAALAQHVNLAAHLSGLLNNPDGTELLRLEDDILQAALHAEQSSINSSTTFPTSSAAAAANALGNSLGALINAYGSTDDDTATLNRIEHLVDVGTPINEVFRLLCLFSVLNNGIKPKALLPILHAIIQTYGFHELSRIFLLHKVGLLRLYQSSTAKNATSIIGHPTGITPSTSCNEFYTDTSNNKGQNFALINRHFRLLVPESEMQSDISYVCSGYSPLSVRLVQLLFNLEEGWRSCSDALNLLHGPALEIRQHCLTSIGNFANNSRISTISQKNNIEYSFINKKSYINETIKEMEAKKQPSVVLIMFLGGVTYSEIAAIRKLSQIEGGTHRYVIATTCIINAKRFIAANAEFSASNLPVTSATT